MRALATTVTLTAALVGFNAAAIAAPGDQVAINDPRGDVVGNGLDIVRGSLQRSADGRMRATVTLARAFDEDDLAATGDDTVPGGICLRLWSSGQAPSSAAPDHLVCMDAKAGKLRGSVLRERAGDLPVRTARATVRRSSSRTLVVRFAQTAIGRPARVRFGFESTRPGCPRTSCIDTAPNAPRSAVLVVRGGTTK